MPKDRTYFPMGVSCDKSLSLLIFLKSACTSVVQPMSTYVKLCKALFAHTQTIIEAVNFHGFGEVK